MVEHDSVLSPIEQEERRRLFWSIYILDRFVSCSKLRPPIILDADCQIQLPCEETDFREGRLQKTDILINVTTGKEQSTYIPGYFALVVLMACALSRCSRYMLDNRHSSNDVAPWDPKSEYVAIASVLLYYESVSEIGDSLGDVVQQESLKLDGKIDQQKAGHMIFSKVLFHLNHCLLNHPFLLRQRIEATKAKVPTTWLVRALKSGLEHARSLSSIFRDAKNAGCIVSTSFYGYCLLIAGTVHALYTHSDDSNIQRESLEYLVSDLTYLDEVSKYWKNTALIVRSFAHSPHPDLVPMLILSRPGLGTSVLLGL